AGDEDGGAAAAAVPRDDGCSDGCPPDPSQPVNARAMAHNHTRTGGAPRQRSPSVAVMVIMNASEISVEDLPLWTPAGRRYPYLMESALTDQIHPVGSPGPRRERQFGPSTTTSTQVTRPGPRRHTAP